MAHRKLLQYEAYEKYGLDVEWPTVANDVLYKRAIYARAASGESYRTKLLP